MSNSLIPPPTAPPPPPQASTTDGQPGRVTSVPQQLAQLPRPVTIIGQVVAHNNDGSVKIQTPQGTIDVALRGQTTPPDGQTVEIDLAAGRPPRTAIVRPADPEQLASATAASAAETENSVNAFLTTPATTGTALTPNSLLADSATASATAEALPPAPITTPPANLQPGDSVRLLPLPPDTPVDLPVQPPSQTATLDAHATPQTLMQMLLGEQTSAAPASSAPLLSTAVPPPAGITAATPLQIQTALTTPLTVAPTATALTPPSPITLIPPGSPALASQTPSATLPTLPQTSAIAPTQPPTQTPATIANIPSLPPELRNLDVRIAAIQSAAPNFTAPAATTPAATTTSTAIVPPSSLPTAATTLPATVIGTIDQPGIGDLPVIALSLPGHATPDLFVMQVPAANLPPGTQLLLAPEFAASAPPSPEAFLPNFQWNSLTNLHAALQAANPAQAAALAAMLPSPASPETMPAAALLFIAALRSGDLDSWLGDGASGTLRDDDEDGAPSIAKLAGDLSGLARLDSAPMNADTGDWRALALPLLWQGEVQKMVMHYRHDRSGQKSNKPERPRGTRFILDFRLTRMGPVQLDGLHRPADRDSRLDLIVRTRTPLSATMQAAMRLSYTRALDGTSHIGEMSFQHRAEQWLRL